MMNFGETESQTVEFSPDFPYQGAFFFLTYHAGSTVFELRARSDLGKVISKGREDG
jgi:hypothetical protein